MTTEGPEPRRQNTALIVLGLAVLLLLATVVGFLLGGRGGGSSDTTLASDTTPTSAPPTTIASTVPATTSATSMTLPPEPAGEQFVFVASEDTVVVSEEPNTVLGTAQILDIEQDGPDDLRSALVRFDVRGLPTDRPIIQATLRLTVLDTSDSVGLVNLVGGPWTEAETTWETAPPVGAPVAPLPAGAEGAQVDIDVTPVVTGPGQVDFYLTVTSQDGADFASRESPTGGPALVITLGEPGATGQPEGTVLVGAGDIASCASDGDEVTATLLDQVVAGAAEAVVFTGGDNAYEDGSEQSFTDCYDPSWGRHKAITRPAVGSREYRTPGAAGYFGYFGEAAGDPALGYYSYNLGGWHIVVLNSNCDQVGGCEAGSAQELWLREDLAANDALCTAAYWQEPLFSSGRAGGNPDVLALFQALYDVEAEVVINGNDHLYERFAPQTPDGTADPEDGIRQFIVGTGGRSLDALGTAAPNSEVRFNQAFGVLSLSLLPEGYEWEFIAESGAELTDVGGGTCQ